MNWDAIGVIAEVVSAIAVVITLVFLTIELRLSRHASEAQLTYSSVELYSRWRTAILQNSDLSCAVAKANRGEPLTEEERFNLTALTDELFIASVTSYESVIRSSALHDRSLELEYLVDFLAANPGLVSEWQRFHKLAGFVSTELVDAVDSKLTQLGVSKQSVHSSPEMTGEANA